MKIKNSVPTIDIETKVKTGEFEVDKNSKDYEKPIQLSLKLEEK